MLKTTIRLKVTPNNNNKHLNLENPELALEGILEKRT